MRSARQREVVLEIEHVRVIRRRATTSVQFCRDCCRSTDFVELAKAAELFGVSRSDLFDFTRANRCHFLAGGDGEIRICLADLLGAMKRKMNVKLLGELHNEESI